MGLLQHWFVADTGDTCMRPSGHVSKQFAIKSPAHLLAACAAALSLGSEEDRESNIASSAAAPRVTDRWAAMMSSCVWALDCESLLVVSSRMHAALHRTVCMMHSKVSNACEKLRAPACAEFWMRVPFTPA